MTKLQNCWEYQEYLIHLKEKKRFLLSIKGEIKILESFEFEMPSGDEIEQRYLTLNKAIS